jgi:hypothetical protein
VPLLFGIQFQSRSASAISVCVSLKAYAEVGGSCRATFSLTFKKTHHPLMAFDLTSSLAFLPRFAAFDFFSFSCQEARKKAQKLSSHFFFLFIAFSILAFSAFSVFLMSFY